MRYGRARFAERTAPLNTPDPDLNTKEPPKGPNPRDAAWANSEPETIPGVSVVQGPNPISVRVRVLGCLVLPEAMGSVHVCLIVEGPFPSCRKDLRVPSSRQHLQNQLSEHASPDLKPLSSKVSAVLFPLLLPTTQTLQPLAKQALQCRGVQP